RCCDRGTSSCRVARSVRARHRIAALAAARRPASRESRIARATRLPLADIAFSSSSSSDARQRPHHTEYSEGPQLPRAATMQGAPHEIAFITSPLEAEHAARIKSAAGDRAELIYDPDLLPPTRYQGDHKGIEGFTRTPEQELRWRAHLARATVLWDFPSG